MTDNELVSIITPAFRCAGVIGETIRSVLAQTYTNWEMLIAEDCSPDETGSVIEQWVKQDPRITLIRQERNGGPAMARNAALESARGNWIAFLDSDDLWLPNKLERCLDFAHKNNAAFVFTGFKRMTAEGTELARYISVPRSLNYRQLLGNTAIATSTVMIDMRHTGPVRMRKTYYDDFDCWLQIVKKGVLAYGLNEDLMRYRIMNSSVSRNKGKSALHVWRAYRELEKLSLPSSLWHFAHYAIRGYLKYR
jgi:teichuronic acid biosynthesis glycosyltransferase TuaG